MRASAQPADGWQQRPEYRIEARLDTANKRVEAHQVIHYTNASPDSLSELVLHLYPNAFRDEESPMRRLWWRQYNGRFMAALRPEERGWIDVGRLTVDGREAEFTVHYTIMRVPLDPPLAPGGAVDLELDWGGQIRAYSTRSGWRGKQFDMAQWYPKMAVYDLSGWDLDTYTRGEFYGDFGSFEVTLDVPADYTVAATGTVSAGDPGWDAARSRVTRGRAVGTSEAESAAAGNAGEEPEAERRVVTFKADQVHDFAWCAAPDFALIDTTWNGIPVHTFARAGDGAAWEDSVAAYGARALEWLDGLVGPYPYPQLTIVHGHQGGGMEYPMLVMCGRADEGLVLHEVGHIYFYGILANDETGHAWLDEGFTTWQTTRYLIERYGPLGKREGVPWVRRLLDRESLRERRRRRQAELLRWGRMEPVDQHSHDFVESYGPMVYGRAALFLDHLSALLGEEVFDQALRRYYQQWSLNHVTEARFRKVLEEVSGMDLKATFDAWLRETDGINFGIDQVESERQEDGTWKTRVSVERIGDIPAPYTLRLVGSGGLVDAGEGVESDAAVDLAGVGNARIEEFEVVTHKRPRRLVVDPAEELADFDRRDNWWPRRTGWAIDWPGFDEPVEEAYTLRLRPGGWYNDVDGIRAGVNLRLGYDHWFEQALVGAWWSEERRHLDYRFRMERPTRWLKRWGRDGRQSLVFEEVEGIRRWGWRFERWGARNKIYPPRHHLGLEVERWAVDERLADTGWKPGNTHLLGVFYDVAPRVYPVDFYAAFHYRHGTGLFQGDFTYDKLAAFFAADAAWPNSPLEFHLGSFIGLSSESTPSHERFFVAGAGLMERHAAPWLATPGGAPDDVHLWLPGQGNVRGYFGTAGDFSAQRMAALQAEVAAPLPLLAPLVSWAVNSPRIFLFGDLASPGGEGVPMANLGTLKDGGVGFRGSLLGTFPLELSFPLWVSHPELVDGSSSFDFRWRLSLRAPWSEPLLHR